MNYWLGVGNIDGNLYDCHTGSFYFNRFYRTFFYGTCRLYGYRCLYICPGYKDFSPSGFSGCIFGDVYSVGCGIINRYPTLKLKGDYFVIATLGIGEVTKLLIENLPSVQAAPEV